MKFRFIFCFFFFFFVSCLLSADNPFFLPVAERLNFGVEAGYMSGKHNYEVEFSTYRYDFVNKAWDYSRIETSKSMVETDYQGLYAMHRIALMPLKKTSVTFGLAPFSIRTKLGGAVFESKGMPVEAELGIRHFLLEDYPKSPAFSVYLRYSAGYSLLESERGSASGSLFLQNADFGFDLARKFAGRYYLSAGAVLLNTFSFLRIEGKNYRGFRPEGRFAASLGAELFDKIYLFFNFNFYNDYNATLLLMRKFEI